MVYCNGIMDQRGDLKNPPALPPAAARQRHAPRHWPTRSTSSLQAPCSKSNVQGRSRIQRKTGTLRYGMPVVLCVSTQVHATRPFTALRSLRACLAGQQVLPCPWRLWALAALRSSARPSRGGCLRQRLPNAGLLAKMLVASELSVRQCRV